MDSISFQSTIRPISKKEFNKVMFSYGKHNFVDYPWTIKEAVYSEKAFTKNVFDCTVCGITDGLKVLMLHICPTRKENKDFSKIIDFIKSKLNLNNPDLQGFLFGSKNFETLGKESINIFKNFEKFFIENQIPYSKIKGGEYINDVAYSSTTDEWLISHEKVDDESTKNKFKTALDFLNQYYDEVKIDSLDELNW